MNEYEVIDNIYSRLYPNRNPASVFIESLGKEVPLNRNSQGVPQLQAAEISLGNGPDPNIEEIIGMRPQSAPIPVQTEPTTVISAPSDVEPIEYPTGYKPKYPQSEFVRENYNHLIGGMQGTASDIGRNIGGMSGDVSGGKDRMRAVLDAIQGIQGRQYEPDSRLEEAISSIQTDRSNAPQIPGRDLWSELILNFGAPVLGALSGESGRIAQLPAGRAARQQFEGQRKEIIDNIREQRKVADTRYKELLQLRKDHRDSWDKSQQRELEGLRALLSGERDLTNMSLSDLQKQEANLMSVNKDIQARTSEGIREIADIETQRERVAPSGRATAKPGSGIPKAFETVDREFAKDFNDWESGGARNAAVEVKKLSDVLKDLESGKSTTGGLTGIGSNISDRLVSKNVLKVRADVFSSIMNSLRPILGAQFTEKEGDRIIKATWNEADSTENNARRVGRLVQTLGNMLEAKNRKAKYFRDRGTLWGFRDEGVTVDQIIDSMGADRPSGRGGSALTPETKTVNGVTYERTEGGWRRVK